MKRNNYVIEIFKFLFFVFIGYCLGNISFFEKYPIIFNILSCVITSGLFTSWMNSRYEISINNEAERIKYEMKRQYMYTEIKTKNLTEIYPKLNSLVLESAGSLPGAINLVQEKIAGQDLKDDKVKELIQFCFLNFFEEERQIKYFLDFSDFLLKNAVFISSDVLKLGNEVKMLIGQMRKVVITEIGAEGFKQYSKEDCLSLVSRLSDILEQLTEKKDLFIEQMNKELSPY